MHDGAVAVAAGDPIEGLTEANLPGRHHRVGRERATRRVDVDVVAEDVVLTTDGGGQKTVKNHDQQRILSIIADQIPYPQRQTEVEPLRELLSIMGRRQTLIRRLNRDIQLQARMRVWLYLHIPLSIALLVALMVHIISTFLYW